MKVLWLDLRHVPVNKRIPFLNAMRQAPVSGLIVAQGDPYQDRTDLPVRILDAKNRILDGKTAIGKWVRIRNASDQKRAATAPQLVVMDAENWRIIPLENLIAARADRPGTLYARARTVDEARTFLATLQIGPDGLVLAPQTPQDIDAVAKLMPEGTAATVAAPVATTSPQQVHAPTGQSNPAPVNANPVSASAATSVPGTQSNTTHVVAGESGTRVAPSPPSVERRAPDGQPAAERPRIGSAPGSTSKMFHLQEATLTAIESVNLADRMCVDATTLFDESEGLLLGSTAESLALVLAETAESTFIQSRPFRVNAGAVSNYTLVPGDKTRYLTELGSGDAVLAVGHTGATRSVVLGRAKIERRPHLLVRWASQGRRGHVVLQNAETVALCKPDGNRLPINRAKPGDAILVTYQPKARHTGMAVAADVEER